MTILFLNDALPQVKTALPALVASPTKIARKLGFPDVIMPGSCAAFVTFVLLVENLKVFNVLFCTLLGDLQMT